MISVIIPTYNSEKYICEAIDSVLCQTYKDYEIIIIDDGSTDNTRTIITERYPFIRYFYNDNRGVSYARNYGISKAQGDLVAFLDADDKWLPEKLEKQVVLFSDDHKLGMAFTENYFFDDHGIRTSKLDKRKRLLYGNIVRNIFVKSYLVTSTVMVRKCVFDDVGLFEEELNVAEDDNMWMRISMKYRIELIDEPLLLYRITEGSLSRLTENIFFGVRKHIEIIENKYPEIHKRLGKSAIKRKYSELFFDEAYQLFSDRMYRKSRKHFFNSYINNPYNIESLLYLVSTFFSPNFIENIRGKKRNLSKQTIW